MRRTLRFALGTAAGLGGVGAYLLVVGLDDVAARATRVTPLVLAAVVALVAVEGLADGIGVWGSARPLGDGLTGGRSVQFALASDFFDTLSPAGPVSSEPIVARFLGVATRTAYGEALGVRAAAKYVKSGAQLACSVLVAAALLVGGSTPAGAGSVVAVVAAVGVGLAVGGVAVVRGRAAVGRALVAVLAPVLVRLPGDRDRDAVVAGVDRFLGHALLFRSAPRLVAVIAVGGLLEQVLAAAALWVVLAGTGTPVAVLPLVAVVPFPQAASVVPVPASLGAYDGLLTGGLVLAAGVPPAAAAAAVLVVRTVSLPFALAVGGVAVALLRGWRP